jgi:hypothetical protein
VTPNPRPAARRIGAALVAVLALAGCTVAAPGGGSTMPDAIVGDDLLALLPDTTVIDAYTQHTEPWSEIESWVGLLEREGVYIDVESCSLVGLGIEFTVETPGGARSRQEGRFDEGYASMRAVQFPSVADAEHIVDLADAAGEECTSYSTTGSSDTASYRVVDVRSEGGIRSVVGVAEGPYETHADIWIQAVNAVLLVQVPVREDAALTALGDDLRAHVAQAVAALAAGPVEQQPVEEQPVEEEPAADPAFSDVDGEWCFWSDHNDCFTVALPLVADWGAIAPVVEDGYYAASGDGYTYVVPGRPCFFASVGPVDPAENGGGAAFVYCPAGVVYQTESGAAFENSAYDRLYITQQDYLEPYFRAEDVAAAVG